MYESCTCGPPTPWLRTARPSRYPRSDDATDVLGIHERRQRQGAGYCRIELVRGLLVAAQRG